MQNVKRLVRSSCVPFISVVVAFMLVGCQSAKDKSDMQSSVSDVQARCGCHRTNRGCAHSCRNRTGRTAGTGCGRAGCAGCGCTGRAHGSDSH